MSESRLPLSALLSQVLIAFTIQVDNEAEHRMPHSTTDFGVTGGAPRGPWLTSMAMWLNCLRYVTSEGISEVELRKLARTSTNLNGMIRWGYVTADPLIRPTVAGRRAQAFWEPLLGETEGKWRELFGNSVIDRLRQALLVIAGRLTADLPDCMPILGYGLVTSRGYEKLELYSEADVECLLLPFLLARVLQAFAIEYERRSDVSLAIGANVLRVLGEESVRQRDLPILSGVSKESISMAVGYLQKRGLVEKEGLIFRLTREGVTAKRLYMETLSNVEADWRQQFGEQTISELYDALSSLTSDNAALLWKAMQPYPDGWRALVRKPVVIPHFPMVLHRGGYPDGS